MKIEYNNIYIHFVFPVYQRANMISESIRIRVEKYITGIIGNYNSKLYAIYANPDHMHILVSKAPSISEETLADAIAAGSAKFINDNKLTSHPFHWQTTASAFSVSKGDIQRVIDYIYNQPIHHKKKTFEEEYKEFMNHYQNTIIKEKSRSIEKNPNS